MKFAIPSDEGTIKLVHTKLIDPPYKEPLLHSEQGKLHLPFMGWQSFYRLWKHRSLGVELPSSRCLSQNLICCALEGAVCIQRTADTLSDSVCVCVSAPFLFVLLLLFSLRAFLYLR